MSGASCGKVCCTAAEFKFYLADLARSGSTGSADKGEIFNVEKFDPYEKLLFLLSQSGVETPDKACDTETPYPEEFTVKGVSWRKCSDAVKESCFVDLPHPVAF